MIIRVVFQPSGQTFEVFDRKDNAWLPIREPNSGDYLLVCGLIAGAIFRDELLAVALFCRVPSTLVSWME